MFGGKIKERAGSLKAARVQGFGMSARRLDLRCLFLKTEGAGLGGGFFFFFTLCCLYKLYTICNIHTRTVSCIHQCSRISFFFFFRFFSLHPKSLSTAQVHQLFCFLKNTCLIVSVPLSAITYGVFKISGAKDQQRPT